MKSWISFFFDFWKTKTGPRLLNVLFLLLISASIIRVNASLEGFESLFLFRILIFVLCLSLLYRFIRYRELVVNFGDYKNLYPIFFLSGAWISLSLISYFWSNSFEDYFRYNVLLGISLAFTLVIAIFVRTEEMLKKIWLVLLVTLVLAIMVAYLELIFGIRLKGSGLLNAGEGYWLFATSFFNHPNDFAGYLSLSLPFLFLLPLSKDYGKYRWYIFALAIVVALTLTFTGSKLNYIATIVSSGLALSILLINKNKEILGYITLILSVLFMLNPSVGPQTVAFIQSNVLNRELNAAAIDRIQGQEIQGSLDEFNQGFGSAEVRKSLIVNGVSVLLTEPTAYVGLLTGVGAGQVESYMKNFSNTENVRNLHNWWLEVFVNYGIFVGTGYVILYLFLLYKSVRMATRSEKNGFLRYFYFSIALILVVYSITSVSPSSSIGYAPLWLNLGLAIAAVSLPPSLYNSNLRNGKKHR